MIEKRQATVYYAPTAKRRYFSLDAACSGEAVAVIKEKYPTIEFESDTGFCFHWKELKRSEVLHRRITKLVKSKYKKGINNE